MTLADNAAIPDTIWNISAEIYAEFMILHGKYSYLQLILCPLIIIILAQLLHACYNLGTHHATVTNASNEE
jgi:hypothetical protein